MAKTNKKSTKTTSQSSKQKRTPPAQTIEGRENQMIALAVNLAEEQLRNGTASSQIITHYLRLGTTRELLEQKRIEQDIKLNQAKTEALESAKHVEELYANAIKAMRSYVGLTTLDSEDDDE
jgi:hypothetical protein